MRLLKEHIVLSFVVGLLIFSLSMGALGLFLSLYIEGKFDDGGLKWTYPPTDKYSSIEVTEDGFVGYTTVDYPAAPDTEMAFRLDAKGEVTGGERIQVFPNGLYYHKDRGEYGAITEGGDVIVKAQYDHINGYGDYIVGGSEDYAYDLYTKDGELILSTGEDGCIDHIENDLFYIIDQNQYFLFNGKTGEKQDIDYMYDFINSDDSGGYFGHAGNLTYQLDEDFMPDYDAMQYQHVGSLSEDGLRYVEIYNPDARYQPHCTYINLDKEIVIDFHENTIDNAMPFSEGKAIIHDDSKIYCIDMEGNELFRLKDRVPETAVNSQAIFSGGYAPVTLDGKTYGYINDKGEWVIEPVFIEAFPVIAGHAAVSLNGETYGIIDVSAGGDPDVK